MLKNIKKELKVKGLLEELEDCRNEEEAINVLKREKLWGVVNYPELEELKESYKNSEIEADGILSISKLDKVAGGNRKGRKVTLSNERREVTLKHDLGLKKLFTEKSDEEGSNDTSEDDLYEEIEEIAKREEKLNAFQEGRFFSSSTDTESSEDEDISENVVTFNDSLHDVVNAFTFAVFNRLPDSDLFHDLATMRKHFYELFNVGEGSDIYAKMCNAIRITNDEEFKNSATDIFQGIQEKIVDYHSPQGNIHDFENRSSCCTIL